LPQLARIADRLSSGIELADDEFDRLFPAELREASERHWTPVAVARRAARLLVTSERTRVLDIGAGIGKFCMVGALATRGTFVGVEQRGSLVEIARRAARRLGAERARFIHGGLEAIDWDAFDAFYLYNPFYEHLIDFVVPPGEQVARSAITHAQHVTTTSVRLALARCGTRVVTYHGFGAPMPIGYRRLHLEAHGGDLLELWIKEAASARRLRS